MSEYTIQARPTVYRGVEMRSRLEAEFAAVLDELGPNWTYEGRAFAGASGQYLPDFSAGGSLFIEVKPNAEFAIEFAMSGRMLVILESIPNAALVVAFPMDGEWRTFWYDLATERWSLR